MNIVAAQTCKICGGQRLEAVEGYEKLARVTSDCRPWPAGGHLLTCSTCGAIQTLTDEHWTEEINRIYASYAIYAQSDGAEQVVFDADGLSTSRSNKLLREFVRTDELPHEGRLLDIGCGNGGLLANFHALNPQWKLFGTEHDRQNEKIISKIPGFQRLWTCAPWEVPEAFDLMTMVHVLEHFPAPAEVLRKLMERFSESARLFIEVPNAAENPFDLVIADHALHFTPAILERLVADAGYEVVRQSTQCVSKEISLLARPNRSAAATDEANDTGSTATRSVAWLKSIIANATEASHRRPFGLFGTSIAANWLFGSVGERVEFFVDEDCSRIGRRHFDRPVVAPTDVPDGACIYVPLAPTVAGSVVRRLARPGVRYEPPPAL